MTKRKIAIIGLGKISIDQHVPAIAAGTDFELAAVAETKRRRRSTSASIAASPDSSTSAGAMSKLRPCA